MSSSNCAKLSFAISYCSFDVTRFVSCFSSEPIYLANDGRRIFVVTRHNFLE